jgi:hypothetical protein
MSQSRRPINHSTIKSWVLLDSKSIKKDAFWNFLRLVWTNCTFSLRSHSRCRFFVRVSSVKLLIAHFFRLQFGALISLSFSIKNGRQESVDHPGWRSWRDGDCGQYPILLSFRLIYWLISLFIHSFSPSLDWLISWLACQISHSAADKQSQASEIWTQICFVWKYLFSDSRGCPTTCWGK